MDTIKKVLHSHHKDKNHPSPLPQDARPDQETLARLGDEPNVTGTNRPPPHEVFAAPPPNNTSMSTTGARQPDINCGHHHPRQPVGATGPPAGHSGAGAGFGAGTRDVRARAEDGNNFPGTNPHPSHSA
jgi:hypothetical protein